MTIKAYKSIFSFGGKVDSSFKGSAGIVSRSISSVSKEIRDTKKEQKLLRAEIKKSKAAGNDVSELERKYEELGREVDKLKNKQERLNQAQQNIGKGVSIIKSATKQMAALGAATTLVTGVTVGLTNSVANNADRVGKQSSKLGLSAEKLQEYRFAADQLSGVSADKFDVAFQRMTRRVTEFSELGKGEAAGALQELGIFTDDIRGKKPDQIFELIADRMSTVEDAGTRLRLGFKLFDSEGVDLVNMFGNGAAGIREMGLEAHRLNGVMSGEAVKGAEDYKDRLGKLQFQFKGLTLQFGSKLLPVMSSAFTRISNSISENKEEIDAWIDRGVEIATNTLPKMVDGGIKLAGVALDLADRVNTVVEFLGGWETVGKGIAIFLGGKFAFGLVQAGIGVYQFASTLPWVATGIKAIGMALVANPIGLIITGGIIAGIAIIKYVWGDFSTWWNYTWEGIKGIVSVGWSVIKFLFNWSPLGIVIRTWKPLIGFFKNIIDRIRKPFGDFFGWIADKFNKSPLGWLAKKGIQLARGVGSSLGFNSDGAATDEVARQVQIAKERKESDRIKQAINRSSTTNRSVTNNQTVEVVVNPAPGQDAQEIGQAVSDAIQGESLFDDEGDAT